MKARLGLNLAGLIAATALLFGCTATEQGAGVGAASGAGLGAIIGHQSGHGGEGAAIGAAAGAIVGGMIGHQVDKEQQGRQMDQAYEEGIRDGRRGTPSSGSGLSEGKGSGTWVEGHYEYVTKKEWVDTTKTERVWVEEQVLGNRRIEAHWEERKVPSGFWRSYEEKIWIPGHYE